MNKTRITAVTGIALIAGLALTGCAASIPTTNVTKVDQIQKAVTDAQTAGSLAQWSPDPSKTDLTKYTGDLEFTVYEDTNKNGAVDKDDKALHKYIITHENYLKIVKEAESQARNAQNDQAKMNHDNIVNFVKENSNFDLVESNGTLTAVTAGGVEVANIKGLIDDSLRAELQAIAKDSGVKYTVKK